MPAPQLIDSHAHLDYEYEEPVEKLLENAAAAGITHVIAISAEPDSLERTQALANRFPQIFHTAGIHPHDANSALDESVWQRVLSAAASPKCVAIGELGLDYFYKKSEPTVQKQALERQLELAMQLGKPIVVHTRDADTDSEAMLSDYGRRFQAKHAGKSPGVIHCFTASDHLAKVMLAAGFYISFSGIITFKNAESLRATVSSTVPLDKLLVETDSPYLAPVPYRGKKNQPAWTLEVARTVALLKNLSLPEVAAITRKNTIKLFDLPIE